MNKSFQILVYVFSVIVGGLMFIFTNDGRILKVCIACNSFVEDIFGIASIVLGVVGLSGTIFSKKTEINGRYTSQA